MTLAIPSYTQACLEAWLNCENLLNVLPEKGLNLSSKFTELIDECAHICMGTFHALTSDSQHSNQMGLLCMGICEECAEVCDAIGEESFLKCANACRKCSKTISWLAQEAV